MEFIPMYETLCKLTISADLRLCYLGEIIEQMMIIEKNKNTAMEIVVIVWPYWTYGHIITNI